MGEMHRPNSVERVKERFKKKKVWAKCGMGESVLGRPMCKVIGRPENNRYGYAGK